MKISWFLGSFLILAGSLNSYWGLMNELEGEQDILSELYDLEKRISIKEYFLFPEFHLRHLKKILHANDHRSSLRISYAKTLMNTGHYDEAIEEYMHIIKMFNQDLGEKITIYLKYSLLEVYLKKHLNFQNEKEDNNRDNELNEAIAFAQECLELPTAKKYGYEEKLNWSLNILHQLKGSYPQGLSEEQLILFEDKQEVEGILGMQNITQEAGLGESLTQAGGVIMDDFNQDGFLDLLASDMGLKGQLRYFINDGKGKFQDHTISSGLMGYFSGVNLVQTDYNNDGLLDFFVTRGGGYGSVGLIPNSLFRNNGDDTFSEVTKEAGLYSRHPTTTATWVDVNNDGWLDLFVGNDDSSGIPLYSELYLNKQNGSFSNITKISGLMFRESVQDACWLDFDQDGNLDLFIAIGDGADLLFQNNSKAESSKISFSRVNLDLFDNYKYTLACQTKDLNNDGWDDLVLDVGYAEGVKAGLKFLINDKKGNFVEWPAPNKLFEKNTPNTFQFWDMNNDGEEEISFAQPFLNPNQTYINQGAMNFMEGTYASGLNYLPTTHAFAIGDIDLDGDQDLYMATGGVVVGERYPNQLYENKGSENNWLIVKLIGRKANKLAIGAKVCVTLESEGKEKKIYRSVHTSANVGASSLQLEIGLAKADTIKIIEVKWPGSGSVQQFHNLEANNFYSITEGNERVIKR